MNLLFRPGYCDAPQSFLSFIVTHIHVSYSVGIVPHEIASTTFCAISSEHTLSHRTFFCRAGLKKTNVNVVVPVRFDIYRLN